MAESYLAVDLGAGSGRVMRGRLGADGTLALEERHRFPNGPVQRNGRLVWDFPRLRREVLSGLQAACASGPHPRSIGVDGWGVDFGLVDRDGNVLGDPCAYRDPRFPEAMEDFLSTFPGEELHRLTGIQILPINTIFQLHAMAREGDGRLQAAEHLLFVPDLLHHALTGERTTEYTMASTSQLLEAGTRSWCAPLLEALGVPARLFRAPVEPGTVIGTIPEAVSKRTGLPRLSVAAPATHDTASAVAAVPAEGRDFAWLSSGTWSLIGIEADAPVVDARTFEANVTNEGGVFGTVRVLKNIMGLWILEECRRAWGGAPALETLLCEADKAPPLRAIFDPADPAFLHPPDMLQAVAGGIRRGGGEPPASRGAVARAVLESLALAYRHALEALQAIRGAPVDRLHVIGGGSKNGLLCRFTADATGLPVLAGPAEATSAGNLLMQAHAAGRVGSLEEIREISRRSFPPARYDPEPSEAWEEAYGRFCAIKSAGE